MTSALPMQANYTQPFLDGAKDVNQPARYKVIGDILKDCASVLDVGCGNGLLFPFIRGSYLGIDNDALAVEEAKNRWGHLLFAQSDANTYDVGQFEAVVLNEVLYYLPSPAAALRRYAAMVLPGGKLIVSVYDKRVPFWRINLNRRALKAARKFAGESAQEIPVEQNGKKWSVLVIHP